MTSIVINSGIYGPLEHDALVTDGLWAAIRKGDEYRVACIPAQKLIPRQVWDGEVLTRERALDRVRVWAALVVDIAGLSSGQIVAAVIDACGGRDASKRLAESKS